MFGCECLCLTLVLVHGTLKYKIKQSIFLFISMQNVSKKLIGVVVLIIAIVVGGWFWYVSKNNSQKQVTSIVVEATNQQTLGEINISSWDVYKNETMGFKVKTPSDWNIYNVDKNTINFTSPETEKMIQNHEIQSTCDLSVSYYSSIVDEPENSLKANNLKEMIKQDHLIKEIGSTMLGDENAIDVIWGGYGAYYSVLSIHNNHFYKVLFCNREDAKQLTSSDRAILQSFEFIN